MLLAFLLLAGLADWVPARWNSADPGTLDLVRQTPINCLLLEHPHWSTEFNEAAARAGIATLGVVRPGTDLREVPPAAAAAKLTGVVLEGDFGSVGKEVLSGLLVIELGPRTHIRFDSKAPILGTDQGVWPGINADDDGTAKAAPSGAPWIDTNGGFLRFARASASGAEIWIANRPPAGSVYPVTRYLQAIGDAAIVGARWVLAPDSDFDRRLLERQQPALRDWKTIADHLRFFEENKHWKDLEVYGQFALVQDADTGGLISGGILDMISVKHTPVRPVPAGKLSDTAMQGARMAVNVDPTALSDEQKEILRRFTRGGGTLLTAPPGWKFPPQRADQITLDKEDIEKLDGIWKEVNSLTGRRNLGARLFNVASMLSNLLAGPSGKPVVLHLVNYSDYPVESVTVHVLGKYSEARLFEPGREPRGLPVFPLEEATGIEIDKVSTMASLRIE